MNLAGCRSICQQNHSAIEFKPTIYIPQLHIRRIRCPFLHHAIVAHVHDFGPHLSVAILAGTSSFYLRSSSLRLRPAINLICLTMPQAPHMENHFLHPTHSGVANHLDSRSRRHNVSLLTWDTSLDQVKATVVLNFLNS